MCYDCGKNNFGETRVCVLQEKSVSHEHYLQEKHAPPVQQVTHFTLMTQINISPFIWPLSILGRLRDFSKSVFKWIPLLSHPLFRLLAFVYSTDVNIQIDFE